MFAVLLKEVLDELFVEAEVGVFPTSFVMHVDDQFEGFFVAVEELVFFVPELLVGLDFQLIEAKLFEVIEPHE